MWSSWGNTKIINMNRAPSVAASDIKPKYQLLKLKVVKIITWQAITQVSFYKVHTFSTLQIKYVILDLSYFFYFTNKLCNFRMMVAISAKPMISDGRGLNINFWNSMLICYYLLAILTNYLFQFYLDMKMVSPEYWFT